MKTIDFRILKLISTLIFYNSTTCHTNSLGVNLKERSSISSFCTQLQMTSSLCQVSASTLLCVSARARVCGVCACVHARVF